MNNQNCLKIYEIKNASKISFLNWTCLYFYSIHIHLYIFFYLIKNFFSFTIQDVSFIGYLLI